MFFDRLNIGLMLKHQPNIFLDLELHYSGFFLALGDEPVQRLCRVVDQQAEYRKAAVDAVRQLSIDVGIPQTLKEIGVKKEDLDALADAAMADVCTGGNPRPCTKELVLGVYQKAFGE